MKLIIAGSRTITELRPTWFESTCHQFGFGIGSIEEVVSGRAHGVDSLGENFANDAEIPIKMFPADWDKHGKSAGHIRNKQMAEYADALLLVWDGESKGSASMKQQMIKLNKPIYEVVIK